jgi:hypothetical protein
VLDGRNEGSFVREFQQRARQRSELGIDQCKLGAVRLEHAVVRSRGGDDTHARCIGISAAGLNCLGVLESDGHPAGDPS